MARTGAPVASTVSARPQALALEAFLPVSPLTLALSSKLSMGARGPKTGHTRHRRRNKRGMYGTCTPCDATLGPDGSCASLVFTKSENNVEKPSTAAEGSHTHYLCTHPYPTFVDFAGSPSSSLLSDSADAEYHRTVCERQWLALRTLGWQHSSWHQTGERANERRNVECVLSNLPA